MMRLLTIALLALLIMLIAAWGWIWIDLTWYVCTPGDLDWLRLGR